MDATDVVPGKMTKVGPGSILGLGLMLFICSEICMYLQHLCMQSCAMIGGPCVRIYRAQSELRKNATRRLPRVGFLSKFFTIGCCDVIILWMMNSSPGPLE